MNIQDWSPLGLTGWISLQSKGLSRVISNTTVQKHQFFGAQLSSQSKISHPYMTTGKTVVLTRQTFVGKVMSLLFNMLSRLVIAFLPRSKYLLILWLRSSSTVTLESKKIKPLTVSFVSPSICHEVLGPDAMILLFWMLTFRPTFSFSSFIFIKRLFSSYTTTISEIDNLQGSIESTVNSTQYFVNNLRLFYDIYIAYLVAQLVKNPPAMQETWVRSLGWEDPLEKGMANNSSILAWRIPRTV